MWLENNPSELMPGFVEGFRSARMFTPVISPPKVHSSCGLLLEYHLSESGWVGEVTAGAAGAPARYISEPKENAAVPRPFNIFVPFPSFAKTEPEEKLRVAVPACLTL